MAYGLPDYYRGVDIAYQSLTTQVVSPVYGGAINSEDTIPAVKDVWNPLVSVGGKGICYGGCVHIHYDYTQRNSLVKIEFDGLVTATNSFYILNHNCLDRPHTSPIYLLKYDDVIFNYAVGLPFGYTFESSMKLSYKEAHGTTPNINFNLIWARA